MGPPKIRSQLTVGDFKRHKPRVVAQFGFTPVRNNQVRSLNLKNPNSIPVKKPVKVLMPMKRAPMQVRAQVRAQVPQMRAQVQLVSQVQPDKLRPSLPQANKSLLKQQLSDVQGRAGVKSQIISKTPITYNIKAVAQLKNVGVGRVLVMIAAGPSVLEIDFSPIRGHPLVDFMCINKPFMPVWPSRFWAFCDHTQQRANKEIWDSYDGVILNSPNVRARRGNQIIIKTKPGRGFSRDILHGYHIGRSSTYANMQVAYFMAYPRVYVCGLDMCAGPSGQLYHYGMANPDVPSDVRKSRFPAEASHFLHGAQTLTAEERSRFVICSSLNTWEFTKYFERLDQKVVVQEILKYLEGLKG